MLTRKTMKNLANKITKFYTGLTEIHHLQTDKNKRPFPLIGRNNPLDFAFV
jgi:hypothetical protein